MADDTVEAATRQIQDPLIRFTKNYVVNERTGCWNWIGARRGYNKGYGYFCIRSQRYQAHRWSYERYIGVIPHGLEIDHLCKNTMCVNPHHLEPVTQRENVLRGTGSAALRAKQSHCINGHPFDAMNTHVRPNGRRRCRACDLAQFHRRQQRKKIAALPDR